MPHTYPQPFLIGSILAFSNAARAAEVNPLRPVDTASPRETLQDFVVTVDGIYRGLKNILQEYAASQRLYLTSDERCRRVETFSAAAKAIKVLDLSDIPPVLQQTVAASGREPQPSCYAPPSLLYPESPMTFVQLTTPRK